MLKVCVCTRKVVLLSPTGQTRGVSGCPTDKQRCAHPTEPLEMLGELRQPALEKGRWDSACGYLGDCHLRETGLEAGRVVRATQRRAGCFGRKKPCSSSPDPGGERLQAGWQDPSELSTATGVMAP